MVTSTSYKLDSVFVYIYNLLFLNLDIIYSSNIRQFWDLDKFKVN